MAGHAGCRAERLERGCGRGDVGRKLEVAAAEAELEIAGAQLEKTPWGAGDSQCPLRADVLAKDELLQRASIAASGRQTAEYRTVALRRSNGRFLLVTWRSPRLVRWRSKGACAEKNSPCADARARERRRDRHVPSQGRLRLADPPRGHNALGLLLKVFKKAEKKR